LVQNLSTEKTKKLNDRLENNNSKNFRQIKKKVEEINLEEETVKYSKKIKSNRTLKVQTAYNEVVRAFLINRR